MKHQAVNLADYTAVARQAAAEGIVMLKNDHGLLPLTAGSRVSVFGRTQLNYYKSGTGSGGMVNTPYVVGILEALQKEDIALNTALVDTYKAWAVDHPFDKGNGWAQEPWSQEEMPLTEETVAAARQVSDTAIVIIGRTAGEDQDATQEQGSYLLTDTEEDMLRKVCAAYSQVAVLLNVSSIMDMSWVERYQPSAVLYVWQAGMEGGHGVADVLMGRVNPCGKLSDTIAKEISDYPSNDNFGNQYGNCYAEDIYVGYRYFETFAKDKVLYPFGFGLSYTDFDIRVEQFARANTVKLKASVTNTGKHPGKEVVQVYAQAPQGLLGKPLRTLVDFGKTKLLQPGETETLEFDISHYRLASYDDSGVTGHPYCYVLEAGTYTIHVGVSVRNTQVAGSFAIDRLQVVEQLSQSGAPKKAFQRLCPELGEDGTVTARWEPVPLRQESVAQHIQADVVPEMPYTGDKGYKLVDVYDGKVSLDDFVAQLSDHDFCCMIKGEGMCSPKVTPGTAAAFGGITDSLKEFGIPCGCCSDGPSGIRMDCGTLAFSLPGGFCLACTFDKKLVETLYVYEGAELRKNKIDALLGPGMNIHRHPLNGRNFEYFSEDPILTGEIAAAQLKGMAQFGVTGTIKHFACNNQEYSRRDVDAVVSERALREIYLKGFEIAVKDGGAYSIMTTYGPLNGVWTAGNYDICTRILRDEWKFDGMVMSDWGADVCEEDQPKSRQNYAAMVKAQNDIYMAISDPADDMGDLEVSLANGTLTRAQLARCAKNILKMVMRSPAMKHFIGRPEPEDEQVKAIAFADDFNMEDVPILLLEDGMRLPIDGIAIESGTKIPYTITVPTPRHAILHMTVKVDALDTAQYPVAVFVCGVIKDSKTISTTKGQWIDLELDLDVLYFRQSYIYLFFAIGGMQIKEMKITIKM